MQQIGPYRIQGEIARGGMGVVYAARGPDGRPVALKLLLGQRSESPQARRRFQVEVQALARLRHPNVVSILGAGEHQGAPWLALEFVQGETLAARLRRGPLPIEEAIGVALQLAQALSYVHACSVLHRDLKPDNVLLRGGEALLTDFGIARDLDASMTRLTTSGVFMGTPGYWPPEQAEGRTTEIGPRSDVYGLGAVLYACLTGRAPVEARTLQDYLSSSGSSPPPARVLRPEVPRWLSALVVRCLAIDPAERPASADAVARALVVRERTPLRQPTPRSRGWGPGLVLGGVVSVALGGVVVARVVGGGDQRESAQPAPREALQEAAAEGPQDPTPEVSSEPTPTPPAAPSKEVQSCLARVLQLERAGRSGEALKLLNQALEALPEAADIRAARGQTLARLGREEEALADLSRAIELEPRHAQALSDRALLHHRRGSFDLAGADFGRAIELAPRMHDVHHRRATLFFDLGRDAEALADCEAELALQPEHAGALMTRGQLRLRAGKPEQALVDLDTACALNPRFAPLLFFRGRAKADLGRHEEAIADFDQAVGLAPGDGQIYYRRAEARANLRDYTGALGDCLQALECGLADDEPTHSLTGWLYMKLEQLDGALLHYDRALELDPTHTRTYYLRGRVHRGRGDLLAALADYERALSGQGLEAHEQAEIHARRGFLLRDLGRHDEALAALSAAIRLDPDEPTHYGVRGTLYSRVKRYREALADFDRVLAARPDDAKSYLLRGEARLRVGDPAGALRDLDTAERLGLPPDLARLVPGVRGEAERALATPPGEAR